MMSELHFYFSIKRRVGSFLQKRLKISRRVIDVCRNGSRPNLNIRFILQLMILPKLERGSKKVKIKKIFPFREKQTKSFPETKCSNFGNSLFKHHLTLPYISWDTYRQVVQVGQMRNSIGPSGKVFCILWCQCR